MDINELIDLLIEQSQHVKVRSRQFTKTEIRLLRKIAKQVASGCFSQAAFLRQVKEMKEQGETIEGIHPDHSYNQIRLKMIDLCKDEVAKL